MVLNLTELDITPAGGEKIQWHLLAADVRLVRTTVLSK